MGRAVYICDFSAGCFTVRSPTGKQGADFEDNRVFGPMFVNMRTGDLRPVPDKHWFWRFYQPWLEAGRPTTGRLQSTPHGPLETAKWANAPECVSSTPFDSASDGSTPGRSDLTRAELPHHPSKRGK